MSVVEYIDGIRQDTSAFQGVYNIIIQSQTTPQNIIQVSTDTSLIKDLVKYLSGPHNNPDDGNLNKGQFISMGGGRIDFKFGDPAPVTQGQQPTTPQALFAQNLRYDVNDVNADTLHTENTNKAILFLLQQDQAYQPILNNIINVDFANPGNPANQQVKELNSNLLWNGLVNAGLMEENQGVYSNLMQPGDDVTNIQFAKIVSTLSELSGDEYVPRLRTDLRDYLPAGANIPNNEKAEVKVRVVDSGFEVSPGSVLEQVWTQKNDDEVYTMIGVYYHSKDNAPQKELTMIGVPSPVSAQIPAQVNNNADVFKQDVYEAVFTTRHYIDQARQTTNNNEFEFTEPYANQQRVLDLDVIGLYSPVDLVSGNQQQQNAHAILLDAIDVLSGGPRVNNPSQVDEGVLPYFNAFLLYEEGHQNQLNQGSSMKPAVYLSQPQYDISQQAPQRREVLMADVPDEEVKPIINKLTRYSGVLL